MESDKVSGQLRYPYRYVFFGTVTGLLLSFGMIPPTISERFFIAIAFMAIFSFFTLWIIYWLNQCITSRQRRTLWIILAVLCPVFFYGFLLGGLLGIAGVFVGLLVPVFVVLPPAVYALRRAWCHFAVAVVVVLGVAPLIVWFSFHETEEDIAMRQAFCAEAYTSQEASWHPERKVCELSELGRLRERLGYSVLYVPLAGEQVPVRLLPEHPGKGKHRFFRGIATSETDVVSVAIYPFDAIVPVEGKDSLNLLVPLVLTGTASPGKYLGVFRVPLHTPIQTGAEHIGSHFIDDAVHVLSVSASGPDSYTGTHFQAHVQYYLTEDMGKEEREAVFPFSLNDPSPPQRTIPR